LSYVEFLQTIILSNVRLKSILVYSERE